MLLVNQIVFTLIEDDVAIGTLADGVWHCGDWFTHEGQLRDGDERWNWGGHQAG